MGDRYELRGNVLHDTATGDKITLPTSAEADAALRKAKLELEHAEAEHRRAVVTLENAKRNAEKVRVDYEHAVVRAKRAGFVAFACLIVGSLLVIGSVVLLWLGAEIYPRRVAGMLAVAWLLLAPWAFATWANSRNLDA
jgi:hypothetical protein